MRIKAVGILTGILITLIVSVVRAHDSGQWEAADPLIREWYRSLMQPDHPERSCCGESDAYWADEIRIRDNKVFAVVTDPRPDGALMRPHVPVGTEVEIPNHKLKYDRGNPTGHSILFMARSGVVFCFVQNTGI